MPLDSLVDSYYVGKGFGASDISTGLAVGAECTALRVGSDIMTFSTILLCNVYVARASKYWRSASFTSDSDTSPELSGVRSSQ